MMTLKHNFLVFIVLFATSCNSPQPILAPGSASTSRMGTAVTQTLKQSEDPAEQAEQSHTIVTETETYFPTNFTLLSNAVVASRSRSEETTRTVIGPAQDNTTTRSVWAKGEAAAAEVKAFMGAVKWLPLLGLLPLGLLVFSLTPYGRAMALSKEGKMALVGASLFLFIAPAVSKAIVDNALILILCTVGGIAIYYVWERKNAYKVAEALRKPPPKE